VRQFEPKIFRSRISPPFNSTDFREYVFLTFHRAGTAADKKQRCSCLMHATQKKTPRKLHPVNRKEGKNCISV